MLNLKRVLNILFLTSLTKEQLQTRVKWMLKDLIKYRVIADDTGLDSRMFAIRSAKHVRFLSFFYTTYIFIKKLIFFQRFLSYCGD